MTDPCPLHTQPLASRRVAGATVEYFAVYPNGRRCRVTFLDALRLEEAWKKEGVRVVTVLNRTPHLVIGELEEL